MEDLLGSIRKFKVGRQNRVQADPVDEIEELVRLYRIICRSADCRGLEGEFDNHWAKLSETKQKILVERLLDENLLPIQIRYALEIFDGRVMSLL